MNFKKQLIALAVILGGCAQQPAGTTQSTSAAEPSISPAQQQLAEQFKSTPCFNANVSSYNTQISSIAIDLSERVQQLSMVNPDAVPEYSTQVFTRYIDELDSLHHYFLATDVDNFRIYEKMLWATFKKGEVKPGFCIYDQHALRIKEALQYVVGFLSNDLTENDINGTESFALRDKNSPFFTSDIERKEYWRKKALYDVLLKVASGTSFPEAKQLMIKRYQGQLSRFDRVNSQDIFSIYANSFLSVLDGHSHYYAPTVSENFNINKSLKLEGIGLVLQQSDEGATVVSTVPGGPSAGKLNSGDIILSVANNGIDFEPISGWRLDDIVERIRGPKGSYVGLEIKPAKQNTAITRFSIMRDTVKLKDRAVESEIFTINRAGKDYAVGVVHIPTFYADFRAIQAGDPNASSTSKDLTQQITKLKQQGISGLVIDLVNNRGASLQEANNAASLFITQRPTFLIAANTKMETMRSDNANSIFTGPIVVIVNDRTAGAAEIFAAALQDYDVGLVVGQRTFGMGSVTSLRQLKSNSDAALMITMAEYFRVTGEQFVGKGVSPDVVLATAALPMRETDFTVNPSQKIASPGVSKMGDLSTVRTRLQQSSTVRQNTTPSFRFIHDTYQDVIAGAEQKTFTLNLKSMTSFSERAQQASKQRFAAYVKTETLPKDLTHEDSDLIEKLIWIDESGELIVDWLDLGR